MKLGTRCSRAGSAPGSISSTHCKRARSAPAGDTHGTSQQWMRVGARSAYLRDARKVIQSASASSQVGGVIVTGLGEEMATSAVEGSRRPCSGEILSKKLEKNDVWISQQFLRARGSLKQIENSADDRGTYAIRHFWRARITQTSPNLSTSSSPSVTSYYGVISHSI